MHQQFGFMPRAAKVAKQSIVASLVVLAAAGSQAGEGARSSSATATHRPAARRDPFDENADGIKDIAAALVRANTDGKYVLLDFGANWCPDCIALSRLFEDKSVRPYFTANFHLVKINVGRRDKNQDLCASYDFPMKKGIPAIVVLAPDGRVLAATRGGELADARTATAAEILDHLKRWRALKPRS
jgi:thioredoxin 1